MTARDQFALVGRISGGRVIDPGSGLDSPADILIDERGRISRIGRSGSGASSVESDGDVLDATGMIVAPGFVDLHVHLREPGREDEETVASGSAAAARGGFTTICCMPNTEPAIADQETVRFVLDRALAAPGRVHPIGAITRDREGKSLAGIAEMVAAGAVAFSDDGAPVGSAGLLRRAMQYSRMFNVPIVEHCDMPDLSADGVMNEGLVSTKLGLRGIPPVSEEICLARDIALARETGAHLHAAHLSTAGSVEIIRRAKAEGVNVTAEVTPHHLILTDDLIARDFDPLYKVNPPLRTRRDVDALRQGLADGVIDCIATDHAPHAEQEKDGEFDLAPFGMVGLETALGVCVKALIETGLLDWPGLIDCLTRRAARAFHLAAGTITVGSPADLVLIDPDAQWRVTPESLISKSKNSPFLGWELTGVVRATIVDGRLVYQDFAAGSSLSTAARRERSVTSTAKR
ncbi:MAG: dihydroorotase [candidate division Zixibacteria bacterium]|nr:dihydroorotase [candidate division Zixibacteria bacterium]